MNKILVIKLGALGDFITALGPMQAVRAHHPKAHITLLTTRPYEKMGQDCGIFNEVWADQKPKWHQPAAWLALRHRLNKPRFDRVYDLQNNDRTALYFSLFSPKPEWVGAVKGASHRNASPERTKCRAYDGHVQTLRLAGIDQVTPDRLLWMKGNAARFQLQHPYVLLVPGCSPQHPRKRWPVEHFRDCAAALIEAGYRPVIIGGPPEVETNAQLAEGLAVTDLTGQTDIYDLADLARGAAGAIGNDTGPSHIISVSECPIMVLYCSQESSIAKHGPLGAASQAIEVEDLSQLTATTVLDKFRLILKKN